VPALNILRLPLQWPHARIEFWTTFQHQPVPQFLIERFQLANFLPLDFGTTANFDLNPIEIGGTDITIVGAGGSVIGGNRQAYWDGQGSNSGSSKYVSFLPKQNHYGNPRTGLITLSSLIKW
jgi:hypothetical protein